MALFFSLGLGIGGVVAPIYFGYLITFNDQSNLVYGYLSGNKKLC